MKETFIFENILASEVEVGKIDKEMEEIENQADAIIEKAETHLTERREGGELESVALSGVPGSTHSEDELQQQSGIMEANKRVLELQAEEKQKEEELYKKAAELELAKQRTDEVRKILSIIDTRSHSTMHECMTLMKHILLVSYHNKPWTPVPLKVRHTLVSFIHNKP